jgi:hypothetical protein
MSDRNDSIFKQKSDAGKGDKPRNISKKYYDNYDQINWNKKKSDNENKN